MTDIREMPTMQEPSEYLADLRRSRQHGLDIAADQGRSRSGNILFRSIGYGAALLLASAVLYVATGAAINEEDHAPQAPPALVDHNR